MDKVYRPGREVTADQGAAGQGAYTRFSDTRCRQSHGIIRPTSTEEVYLMTTPAPSQPEPDPPDADAGAELRTTMFDVLDAVSMVFAAICFGACGVMVGLEGDAGGLLAAIGLGVGLLLRRRFLGHPRPLVRTLPGLKLVVALLAIPGTLVCAFAGYVFIVNSNVSAPRCWEIMLVGLIGGTMLGVAALLDRWQRGGRGRAQEPAAGLNTRGDSDPAGP